jgi:hypothetical protein
LDFTSGLTNITIKTPGLADRTFQNQPILSPAGRSATMPAAFFNV